MLCEARGTPSGSHLAYISLMIMYIITAGKSRDEGPLDGTSEAWPNEIFPGFSPQGFA